MILICEMSPSSLSSLAHSHSTHHHERHNISSTTARLAMPPTKAAPRRTSSKANSRSLSAFRHYQNVVRGITYKQHPTMTPHDFDRYTAGMYRILSKKERSAWEACARADKRRHHFEITQQEKNKQHKAKVAHGNNIKTTPPNQAFDEGASVVEKNGKPPLLSHRAHPYEPLSKNTAYTAPSVPRGSVTKPSVLKMKQDSGAVTHHVQSVQPHEEGGAFRLFLNVQWGNIQAHNPYMSLVAIEKKALEIFQNLGANDRAYWNNRMVGSTKRKSKPHTASFSRKQGMQPALMGFLVTREELAELKRREVDQRKETLTMGEYSRHDPRDQRETDAATDKKRTHGTFATEASLAKAGRAQKAKKQRSQIENYCYVHTTKEKGRSTKVLLRKDKRPTDQKCKHIITSHVPSHAKQTHPDQSEAPVSVENATNTTMLAPAGLKVAVQQQFGELGDGLTFPGASPPITEKQELSYKDPPPATDQINDAEPNTFFLNPIPMDSLPDEYSHNETSCGNDLLPNLTKEQIQVLSDLFDVNVL
jgi:hypothetical protein